MLSGLKYLDKGNQGKIFLARNGNIVKIEPIRIFCRLSVGDDFGLNVVPKLKPDIAKHFMKIFEVIPFVTRKELKQQLPDQQFFRTENYKITICENAGKEITPWHNELCYACFHQLFYPVITMNKLNYFHNDLASRNIVMDKNNNFVIIDYGIMTNVKTLSDVNFLYSLLIPELWIGIDIMRQKENRENLNNYIEHLKDIYQGPKKYIKNYDVMATHTYLFHRDELAKLMFGDNPPKIFFWPLRRPPKIMWKIYRLLIETKDYDKMYEDVMNLLAP